MRSPAKWLFVALPVAACAAVLLVVSGSSPQYRFICVVFDESPGTVVLEGVGKPEQFRALFEPSGVYVGPHIDIPEDAHVFGALVAVHGDRIQAIPLRAWTTDAGVTKVGCNGPAPQFAHVGETRSELLGSISRVLSAGH